MLEDRLLDSAQSVKAPRVLTEDLFYHSRIDIVSGAHVFDELRFLRRIVVAVIRSDHDVIFADVLDQVGQFLVSFAGDPDAVFGKKILGIFVLQIGADGTAQYMNHVGHPASRGLDEPEPEVWKLLRYPVSDEVAERHHGQNAIVREGVITLDVEKLHQIATPRAGVNAYRQIEAFRFGIDGKKMRIVQGQIAFHAAKENSDGALFLCQAEFLSV